MSKPGERVQRGTAISVERLVQRFGDNTVLAGIDLQLEAGQVLALLGPSGCGKTTLLKLLAGLLPVQPGMGSIRFGHNVVAGDGRFVPPEGRALGMVFQDYALWPHMTVGRNVSFALEMRGVSRRAAAPNVAQALETVGLAGFEQRQPSSLSGGQQQRVALARAIVARPQVLLFDEPLSNLDRELRENLCHEIGVLLRQMGTTAVYVTHDQDEAFALADQVAVMHGGRIHQLATPEQLMATPASTLVADFLKLGTLLSAAHVPPAWHAALPAGGADQHLFIPHAALSLAATQGDLRGTVMHQRLRQGRLLTQIVASEAPQGLMLATDSRLDTGRTVELALDWQRLRWLPQAA
ncbi:ABC transporter ATP-binding protein [Herbaspirillum sp. alder98]|uniref:ABC transporter ATP-binding protein n=1 Tax=Herbaspirillum sp. alder98 TaxID=2913096 RepID=UPI001CD89752|nr:ABC transporter ATP-binding protein [Herbaspirillum sp. alder98]MCA1326926.1 ABC transporter ATP-binding protein [Herbaspirillum sp. alder98]